MRPDKIKQYQASNDEAEAEEKKVLPKRGHHAGSGNSEEILNGRPQLTTAKGPPGIKSWPPRRQERSN